MTKILLTLFILLSMTNLSASCCKQKDKKVKYEEVTPQFIVDEYRRTHKVKDYYSRFAGRYASYTQYQPALNSICTFVFGGSSMTGVGYGGLSCKTLKELGIK